MHLRYKPVGSDRNLGRMVLAILGMGMGMTVPGKERGASGVQATI
jgi:hypothetical protein